MVLGPTLTEVSLARVVPTSDHLLWTGRQAEKILFYRYRPTTQNLTLVLPLHKYSPTQLCTVSPSQITFFYFLLIRICRFTSRASSKSVTFRGSRYPHPMLGHLNPLRLLALIILTTESRS